MKSDIVQLEPGVHSKLWHITAFLNIELKKIQKSWNVCQLAPVYPIPKFFHNFFRLFLCSKKSYLPSSLGVSSLLLFRSCSSLSRFLSNITLSSPPGLELAPGRALSGENSIAVFVWVGVVASDAEPWWCFLGIRGEFLAEFTMCLVVGGSDGGGLDEPSLGVGAFLLPLKQDEKQQTSTDAFLEINQRKIERVGGPM